MSSDEIEEDFLELLGDDNYYKGYDRSNVSNELVLRKLEEILYLLKKSTKIVKSDCEEILDKGFVIKDHFSKNSNPNLIAIELNDGRFFVTFKDTMDLLLLHFKIAKKEDIENEIPKRLIPIFLFLKRNGLVYFDARDKEYKITI